MKKRIRLPKSKFRFVIFVAYNLFFVLYMANIISNIYYLVTISFFCLTNAFVLISKKTRTKYSIREFRHGITYVVVLFVISLLIQFYHGDFGLGYLLSDIIRLALPVINAYLFVNTIEKEDYKKYFNVFLFRFVFQFVLINFSSLSLSSIASISWLSSSSSLESSLAHDFMIMEMFYLAEKEKTKAFVCLVFCMLSMKRLSFILAPLLFVIASRIDDSEVKPKAYNLVKVAAIASPLIIILLYSRAVQSVLLEKYGINLNSIMTGRIEIFNTLTKNIPYYNGLGSINHFLGNFVIEKYGTTWNGVLHNDLLRIFLETTIVGTVCLVNSLVEIGRKNKWHFLMICYLLFVAATSHILNYFSVWVTFYMIVMCYWAKKEKK